MKKSIDSKLKNNKESKYQAKKRLEANKLNVIPKKRGRPTKRPKPVDCLRNISNGTYSLESERIKRLNKFKEKKNKNKQNNEQTVQQTTQTQQQQVFKQLDVEPFNVDNVIINRPDDCVNINEGPVVENLDDKRHENFVVTQDCLFCFCYYCESKLQYFTRGIFVSTYKNVDFLKHCYSEIEDTFTMFCYKCKAKLYFTKEGMPVNKYQRQYYYIQTMAAMVKPNVNDCRYKFTSYGIRVVCYNPTCLNVLDLYKEGVMLINANVNKSLLNFSYMFDKELNAYAQCFKCDTFLKFAPDEQISPHVHFFIYECSVCSLQCKYFYSVKIQNYKDCITKQFVQNYNGNQMFSNYIKCVCTSCRSWERVYFSIKLNNSTGDVICKNICCFCDAVNEHKYTIEFSKKPTTNQNNLNIFCYKCHIFNSCYLDIIHPKYF